MQNEEQSKQEAKLEDLQVEEESSDEVKGGGGLMSLIKGS
jgi:hypothetical protein